MDIMLMDSSIFSLDLKQFILDIYEDWMLHGKVTNVDMIWHSCLLLVCNTYQKSCCIGIHVLYCTCKMDLKWCIYGHAWTCYKSNLFWKVHGYICFSCAEFCIGQVKDIPIVLVCSLQKYKPSYSVVYIMLFRMSFFPHNSLWEGHIIITSKL